MDRTQALANWDHHVATSRPCSDAEMLARVARYSELPASPRAFADTTLPGHARTLMSVIGRGVTDDPDFKPAIPFADNFHVDYIEAEQGNGAALHTHLTEEVFVVITGRWRIAWGDEGAQTVELGEGDVISVPPGVMRSFACIAPGRHRMLSILGGHDPGRVKWAHTVAEAGRAGGVGFDDAGNAVRFG